MVATLVGRGGGGGGAADTVGTGGWLWLNARATMATNIAGKTTARVIRRYCFLITGATGGLAGGLAGASSFTGCTWSNSFTMSSVIQVAAAAQRTGDCWSP